MTTGQPNDPPEPAIPGQMDVYEVLAEIQAEPPKAPAKPKPLTAAQVVAKRLREETR